MIFLVEVRDQINESHYTYSLKGDYRISNFKFTDGLYIIMLAKLLPTLIPLSEVGTTCLSSCCDKGSAIIFRTGRLPDANPP
jgi:hypothetical protein